MLDTSDYPQSIIIITILRIIKDANGNSFRLILKSSFFFEALIQKTEEDFYAEIHYS